MIFFYRLMAIVGIITGCNELLIHDESPTLTTLLSAPNAISNQPLSEFSFACNKIGCSFVCKIDDNKWERCLSPQAYEYLADGPHAFSVRAIDTEKLADTSFVTYAWTIDKTAPKTTLDSFPSNPSASIAALFIFCCDKTEDCSFECSLDESDWQTCLSPMGYVGLAEASHIFKVRAIDRAGNIEPEPVSYTWEIDTDLKPVSAASPFSISNLTPGLTPDWDD